MHVIQWGKSLATIRLSANSYICKLLHIRRCITRFIIGFFFYFFFFRGGGSRFGEPYSIIMHLFSQIVEFYSEFYNIKLHFINLQF